MNVVLHFLAQYLHKVNAQSVNKLAVVTVQQIPQSVQFVKKVTT
jgi:hypothetical protein